MGSPQVTFSFIMGVLLIWFVQEASSWVPQGIWGEITRNISSWECKYKPHAFLAWGPLFIMKENLKAKANYSHDSTSDTLVSPVRMKTAWLNSDPLVTIEELLRLNKRLDQKIRLEMAPSVCDELINIFFFFKHWGCIRRAEAIRRF